MCVCVDVSSRFYIRVKFDTLLNFMMFLLLSNTSLENAVFRVRYNLTKGKYLVGSKSFRPDQLFKVTEVKQLCYFST